jgi:hypothetical protein
VSRGIKSRPYASDLWNRAAANGRGDKWQSDGGGVRGPFGHERDARGIVFDRGMSLAS